MPVPQIEEPERFPGGADALCDRLGYGEITTLPLGCPAGYVGRSTPSDPSSGDGPASWDEAPHPSQP